MIIFDPELGEIDTENFTKEQSDRIKNFAKNYDIDLSENSDFEIEMQKQVK